MTDLEDLEEALHSRPLQPGWGQTAKQQAKIAHNAGMTIGEASAVCGEALGVVKGWYNEFNRDTP